MANHLQSILSKLIPTLALLLATVAVGCQSSETEARIEPSRTTSSKGNDETTVSTTNEYQPSRDLDGFRELTTIPGEPIAIWWGIHSQGGSSGEDHLPAPTDQTLVALIEYDNATTVTNLMGDAFALPGSINTPFWFPQPPASDEGTGLELTVYRYVEGFSDGVNPAVVDEHPNMIIVALATT